MVSILTVLKNYILIFHSYDKSIMSTFLYDYCPYSLDNLSTTVTLHISLMMEEMAQSKVKIGSAHDQLIVSFALRAPGNVTTAFIAIY